MAHFLMVFAEVEKNVYATIAHNKIYIFCVES